MIFVSVYNAELHSMCSNNNFPGNIQEIQSWDPPEPTTFKNIKINIYFTILHIIYGISAPKGLITLQLIQLENLEFLFPHSGNIQLVLYNVQKCNQYVEDILEPLYSIFHLEMLINDKSLCIIQAQTCIEPLIGWTSLVI